MNDKVLFKVATELQADAAAMSRALRLQRRANRREVERIQATSKIVQGVQDRLYDVQAIDEVGQIELF